MGHILHAHGRTTTDGRVESYKMSQKSLIALACAVE